jgi:hypothetical protein
MLVGGKLFVLSGDRSQIPLHRLSNCSCEPRHARDLTEELTGDPIRALLRVEGNMAPVLLWNG